MQARKPSKASAEKDDLVRQNLRMECELRTAMVDKDSYRIG